ncbi:hypothetical protein POM88_028183 [Heracleum sosnowskyi]|uniref:Peptidase S1 domain-containing protein n=1 Tax=Heracleum sosnowskyi TaxID=360622 RepID=A0AAD8MQV5_9APIA|nr:hypothetical protein POM88_028183 [Heracleum sosnowskyi]
MARVSSCFSTETFTNKLANGIVMVYLENSTAPWTGTIVGAKSNQTLILTASHCIEMPQLPLEVTAAKLRVMFNGERIPYPADICVYREKTEVLILRVNRYTNPAYKFKFAPSTEHNLKRFQPIVTYAHPHNCVYQSADGTICSEEFKNASIGYDPNMIFFNHRMDLSMGCSGASIFNESENIVGIQSGRYVDTFNVLGARPFDTLLRERKEELEKASLVKQSKMKPGSVSLADEMRNLNDEMGKLTVSFSEGSCMRQDIYSTTRDSIIKYELLEDMFIVDSSLAASSSSRSRKSWSFR